MRSKTDITTITVSKELSERVETLRQEFEKTIGGGIWSKEDAIWELIKLTGQLK